MSFVRTRIWLASLCLVLITASPQGPRNVEASAIYAAEPLAATAEAPNGTTETSNDTTQTPNDTTEAPNDTTEAPKDTTEAPKDTTEAPKDTTEAPKNTTETPEKTDTYNYQPYYIAFGVFSGLAITSVCVAIYTDCRSRRMRRIMRSYQEIRGEVRTDPEHVITRLQHSPQLPRTEEPSQAQRDALAQNIIDLHAPETAAAQPLQKVVEVHKQESKTSEAPLETSPQILLDLSEPEPPKYDGIGKASETRTLEPSTVETIQKLVESLENYEPEPQNKNPQSKDLLHEIEEPEPATAHSPPKDFLHGIVDQENPKARCSPEDLLSEFETEPPLAQSPPKNITEDEVDASEPHITQSSEENLLQDISAGPETSQVSNGVHDVVG